MGRLQEKIAARKNNLLNIYFTAGYPELNDTLVVMEALESQGADIIELGMPYSDPLADGPVIQRSSSLALANGMSIRVLFEQLKDMRKRITIPVILMGYMNPVLQYGFEKFCAEAAACGVDGLILPDLPPFEFESRYGRIIKQHGLDFIFLVTPETADERIKKLDELSSGFLYAVSSSSITGGGKKNNSLDTYLQRLNDLSLKNPVLVGFGISDKAGFQEVCKRAQGAVIGSAFIKALENSGDVKTATKSFLSSLLD